MSKTKQIKIGYFSVWVPDQRAPQDQRLINPKGYTKLNFTKETAPDFIFVEGLPQEVTEKQHKGNFANLYNCVYRIESVCKSQILARKVTEIQEFEYNIPGITRTLELKVDDDKWLTIAGIHFRAPYCFYDKKKAYYIKNFTGTKESMQSFDDTYENNTKFKDILLGDFNTDIRNTKTTNVYDIEMADWLKKFQASKNRELLYDKSIDFTQCKDNAENNKHYLDFAFVEKSCLKYVKIKYGEFRPDLSDHRYMELIVDVKQN